MNFYHKTWKKCIKKRTMTSFTPSLCKWKLSAIQRAFLTGKPLNMKCRKCWVSLEIASKSIYRVHDKGSRVLFASAYLCIHCAALCPGAISLSTESSLPPPSTNSLQLTDLWLPVNTSNLTWQQWNWTQHPTAGLTSDRGHFDNRDCSTRLASYWYSICTLIL